MYSMNQEHAWCLAIERLTGTEIPRRASLIRVLFSEIGRVQITFNVTTQAMDVGALPSIMGFEERKLMILRKSLYVPAAYLDLVVCTRI